MPSRAAACAIYAAVLLAAGLASAQTPPPEPLPAPAPPPPPAAPLPPKEPPDPIFFEAAPRLGFAYRLGGGSAFQVTSRAPALFGLSVGLAPSPRWAVGLAYEHGELGEERGSGDLGDVVLSRSLDALWATVRLAAFRGDWFALNLTLGPGLAWQHVDASVIVLDTGSSRPTAFNCTETGGPGLGLRAGIGAEVKLGEHAAFSLDGVFDTLRLSSDPLGTCVPGAGSVTLLGARASLAYRLDVSRYTR